MPHWLVWPYTLGWAALCAIASALVVRAPSEFALTQTSYWRFLCAPWKLATFALAACFLTLAAPYTGDPYWDRTIGFVMSALTFATAPWAVGALYGVVRRALPWRQGYVALCAWMLSASWCYDLYNRLRLGVYPSTWAANIAASSVLYACAGLCWNLTVREGTGVTFGFLIASWPDLPRDRRPAQMLGYIGVFVAMVAAMLLPFVWDQLAPSVR